MENMKKEINLQDLEAVTGGWSYSQLTQEEIDHVDELKMRALRARDLNEIGKVSDEELDRLEREFYEYSNYLYRKYG